MKWIYFTSDSHQPCMRSRGLRGALIRNGFPMRRGPPRALPGAPEQIWFHGLSHEDPVGVDPALVDAMRRFAGRLSCLFFSRVHGVKELHLNG